MHLLYNLKVNMSYQLHHLQQQHIWYVSSNWAKNENDFLTVTLIIWESFWKVVTKTPFPDICAFQICIIHKRFKRKLIKSHFLHFHDRKVSINLIVNNYDSLTSSEYLMNQSLHIMILWNIDQLSSSKWFNNHLNDARTYWYTQP
jgi:hypothetical protein